MATAAIRGHVRVDCESPFICTFTMKMNDEIITAALMGDLGRALHGTLRIHDIVEVDGHFITAEHITGGQVYAIERMILPQDAATGRNLNAYA